MKKLLFGVFVLSFLSACNSDNISTQNENPAIPETTSTGSTTVKRCASEEIRQEALENSPELRQRFTALEAQTEKFTHDLKLGKVLADGSVEIPVVVNVLYNTDTDKERSNIDTKITEQIAVLNADYAGTNSDVSKIPTEFGTIKAGDTKIKFKLINTIKKLSSKTDWNKDEMKSTASGGIAATDPAHNLNIWVVNKILLKVGNADTTILGYATFPESAGSANDGVVIATLCFGKTGTQPRTNLGRTATHEVGHYLNLKHIWGDADCGDDLVTDTPQQKTKHEGKPTYPLKEICGGTERSVMFMNYMDYVDDDTMFMFSSGQKTRMSSVLATNGARAGLR